MRTRELNGAVVVVTGASSGIGYATALAFARSGASVVVAARRAEPLGQLVAECRSAGAEALAVPTDVTDPEAVDALARTAVERFGALDVWVNNAAVMLYHRFGEEPLEDVRRLIDVNLLGYLLGARAALPRFRDQGAGVLVNVGSVVGVVPGPYMTAYAATKHAVRGLTACLRTELVDARHVYACIVVPGSVDTPLFDHAANHTGRGARALRPTLSPERVAAAVVSCAARPRAEVYVGVTTRLDVWAYALSKRLTERASARIVHREHFLDRAAEPSSGNLHSPVAAGTRARGGWKAGTTSVARGLAVAAGAALVSAGLVGARLVAGRYD